MYPSIFSHWFIQMKCESTCTKTQNTESYIYSVKD